MSTTSRRLQSRRLSVALLLSLLAPIPSARADVAEEQEAIRDNYAAYLKAFKARDAGPIIAMETWDYSERTAKGRTISKQQIDAAARYVFSITRSISKADIRARSIVVKGSTATVIVTNSLRVILVDPGGKDHVYTEESRARDSWVKGSSGWHVRSSQHISGAATVDGRKLPLD